MGGKEIPIAEAIGRVEEEIKLRSVPGGLAPKQPQQNRRTDRFAVGRRACPSICPRAIPQPAR
jgi:hypothetical protein